MDLLLLNWLIFFALSLALSHAQEVYNIEIVVPKVRRGDDYVCSGWKVPSQELYVVDVKPYRISENVHHIMLYGCKLSTENYRSRCRSVCSDGPSHVLYVWGRYVPDINFPRGDATSDVGFRIGYGTEIRYLVLQIHYNPTLTVKPSSGTMQIAVSPDRPQFVAGIFTQSIANATIPAKAREAHIDITCSYDEEPDLHVFAYRMHTHGLGQTVASYKVNETWHLMAYGNPQQLQAFYPLRKQLNIRKGDHLVTRCVYNASGRNRDTKFGYTLDEEMCNIYLMYYTNSTSTSFSASRGFRFCQGNNVPDLVSRMPSAAGLRLDQGGDSTDENDDGLSPSGGDDQDNWKYHRSYRGRLGSSKPVDDDPWSRSLEDQSSDAGSDDEVMAQRSRHRFHGDDYQATEPRRGRPDEPSSDLSESRAVSSAATGVRKPLASPTTVTSSTLRTTTASSPSPSSTTSVKPSTSGMTSSPGVHQSVKKSGVSVPHVSIDDGVDQSIGDSIETKTEQPTIMGASLVIGSLIVVPFTIILIVTVCSRLRKRGVCKFGNSKRRNRHLNIGNLLSRGGQRNGVLRQANQDEEYRAELLESVHSDEESEVEEFSNSLASQGKA